MSLTSSEHRMKHVFKSFYFVADFYPGSDTDTQKCYITSSALVYKGTHIHILIHSSSLDLSLSISVCHTNVPSQASTLKPDQWGSGIRLRGETHSPPMEPSPVGAVVRH